MKLQLVGLSMLCCFLSPKNMHAQYVSFFAHGLAANSYQYRSFVKTFKKSDGSLHKNSRYIIDLPIVSFDFPDSAHHSNDAEWFLSLQKVVYKVVRGNYCQTSLGQDNEIAHLQKVIQSKFGDGHYRILFAGVSRGASIFFTWASKHCHDIIVAAVLESPYASIADVVFFKRQQFGLRKVISQARGQSIMELLFRKYKRTGVKPIDCIGNINKEVPILIVTAVSDFLVPWQSSFALYKKLRQHGHTKVHFLLLQKGRHGFLLTGPEGKKYQQTVHAFYKAYGLPHDPDLAAAGQQSFEQCTPEWA